MKEENLRQGTRSGGRETKREREMEFSFRNWDIKGFMITTGEKEREAKPVEVLEFTIELQ